MSNYQIKLTPVSDYFFGGEKHVLNKNKLEAEYYVKSELYPQQTALLGLLRYYLLLVNDCLNPKKNSKEPLAEDLIGAKSFEFGFKGENKEDEQTFGKIKTISPLYFIKGEDKFIFAPISFGDELISDFGTYRMKDYNAKNGYSSILVDLKNINNIVPLFKDKNYTDFVFIESKTVGNKKGTGGKTEDDGFYKQDMYQLNKGWAFGFDAVLDVDLADIDIIIPMGAEKRLFKLEICKHAITDFHLTGLSVNLPSIFCISDCFVDEQIFEKVTFAVNQNVSFRNLVSKISSSNYSRFSQNNKGYKRSNRNNLMKRGSILHFKVENDLKDAEQLFKNRNAENIGLNKIIILTPNK